MVMIMLNRNRCKSSYVYVVTAHMKSLKDLLQVTNIMLKM
jgi:hypothetical protein